ncbi:MAG: AAA family ATPase [Actinomycetota bacterium]|nr:AAA family ATPase [Actinomycetota bacterium]
MRVHSLSVTAFGPFAATVLVDLDALSRDGLFLLCGPTGAGKTSLLDAIAFALYGRVPGARGQEKRLRSDHADPRIRTEVVCDLTLRGERVRITRRPEQERPKARGSGTTKDQALLHVQRQVGGIWEPVSIRLDEGGEYLRDQVGLSAEQFWQVVLLPQGEFAEFLRAEPDQRARVLETLFDASRFSDVEDWLAEHARATAAALAVAEESVDRLLHRVEQVARSPSASLAEVEVLSRPATEDPEQVQPYVASQLARAQALLQIAEAEDAATQTALDTAENGRDRARRAVRAVDRLLAACRTRDSLANRAESLTEHRQRLAAATFAEPLRSLLEADAAEWSHLRQAANELSDTYVLLTGLDVGELCPVRLHPAHGGGGSAELDGDSAGLNLDLVLVTGSGKAAVELRRWSRSLRDEVARISDRMTELDRVVADEQRLADLIERQAGRQSALDELEVVQGRIAPGLVDLEHRRDAARLSAAGAKHAAQALSVAQIRVQAATRAKELTTLISAAKAEQLKAERKTLTAKAEWLSLREARLAGIAAELAARLADGQNCPVCGSIEHPVPAQPTRTVVTASDERAAADLHESLAQASQEATERMTALCGEFEVCSSLTSGATLTAVRKELAAALNAEATARAAVEHLPALIAERADLLAGQRELTQQITKMIEEQSADRAAAKELRSRVHSGRLRLDKARGEDESLLLRRDRLAALAAAAEAVEQAWAIYAQTRAVAAATRTRLDDRLLRSDFAGPQTAMDALLDEGIRNDLASGIREYEDATTRASAELTAATEELHIALSKLTIGGLDAALPGKDPQAQEVMELAKRLREVRIAHEQEHSAAVRARDRAVGALSRARANRGQLGELEVLLDQAVAECSPLRGAGAQAGALAALVAGAGANVKKMRLRSYVLAARLEQVAAAATARLRQMSSGRYGFVHCDDLRGGNRRSGLSVDILDSHTGTQRPTKTLSGGESFMAALALALGLADVVTAESGGITLNTLFVDEGFGGLDPDSLDAVMTVLDELRQSGRVVGIVSHVEELRTRVPMQLHIQTSPHGSTLELGDVLDEPVSSRLAS